MNIYPFTVCTYKKYERNINIYRIQNIYDIVLNKKKMI